MEEKFENFDEMVENISRGGEIQFEYHGLKYTIAHILIQKNKDVFYIYEVASKKETIYEIENGNYAVLGEYLIDGRKLRNIVNELTINFRCF